MAGDGMTEHQKLVLSLRKEFLQKLHNPHKHMSGEGGTVFDSALYRFQAMRVSNYEHFKPTYKSFKTGFLVVAFPIMLFAYLFKWERDSREAKVRAGLVAYKDRLFKFI